MVSEIEHIEKRQNRIEDAIERLTEISADLNKMLAVQDQRIMQQEKITGIMEETLERRREEYDRKIQTVYDTIGKEDKKILDELEKIRKDQKNQYESLNSKITSLEKIIWMYLGGFSVLVFVITYGPKAVEIFIK